MTKPVSYKEQQKNHTLGSYQEKTQKNNKEMKNMTTIKEDALAYESKQTKNISELEKVDVNMNIEDREGKNKEGEVFKYKVAIIEGREYRVPLKVLGDLKVILEKNKELTFFTVSKQGTGMNTTYTTIPL